MLSDGHNDGLMVGGGVDRRELVKSWRKTGGNISSQLSTGSSSVQALEESELLGVAGLSLIKRVQSLNNDVRVSFDLTLCIKLLRSSEVVGLRIDEEPSLHVLNRHLDGERRASLDSAKVLRKDELGRRHVVDGWDSADRGGVA